jgi:Rieske Fe-S protein
MSNSAFLDEEPRRGFIVRFMAGTIGAVLGLIPLSLGSAFFLDPLIRKSRAKSVGQSAAGGVQKDEEGFINLQISAASLPEDGTPQSFKVHDDKVDAWNMFRNVEIGTVWLRRQDDGQVIAFSTICPHLGCGVDYRSSNKDFYCPCHTSTFSLNGERLNRIPPRDMDSLEVKLKPETGDMIWIKYATFRAATDKKIPI